MNPSLLAFVAVCAVAVPIEGPAIPYFTTARDIHIAQPAVQNYLVVDEEIWSQARPELEDVRIYDGESRVQYALSEQRGGTSSREEPAKILNLGSLGGRTEFDVDTGLIGEYDRIRLQLDARNFVVTAAISGSNELGGKPATQLPLVTLYDFTREELGSNPVLKLPPSSFRYLHVSLSPGILPAQVTGATIYNLEERKAVWSSAGSCGTPAQVGRTTMITCNSPARVPLDRVRFHVDPKQVNFRREVMLSDTSDRHYGTSGEISRVRMNRGGATVVSEDMDVPVRGATSGQLKITLDNGDNPPLTIAGVELLSIERRLYFDPQAKSLLRLYYGDSKLGSPEYDYARFFKPDPAAARVELGPAASNQAYTGRPDVQPWSERHKVVLWVVMLVAVIVLGATAIRGLKPLSS